MFKKLAVDIADKLLPAFNTPTGIPKAMINLKTYVWCSSLSDTADMVVSLSQLTFQWFWPCSFLVTPHTTGDGHQEGRRFYPSLARCSWSSST